ncbi:MAG: MFS transporter [Treponema sp.]|jgi:MFS family permease|nr:MFS transporter [Treponema sp.]
MNQRKSGFGPYLGVTFLIGFGFLTMGLMDPLYDTYVPLFLSAYLESHTAVGALMTVDNILQLALIPVIALWSDRTRTRLGRRMPFIVVMLPLSAILFSFLPQAAALSLLALLALIFVFNIFKTSVRGPVVALMPDTVPAEYRSEANGIINTMGGVGLIISTLVLARLINSRILPPSFPPAALPFGIAALCILAAVLVLVLLVREKLPDNAGTETKTPVLAAIRRVFTGEAKSSVGRILIALFCWFLAYEGIKPFLGLYLVNYVGVDEGSAALAQGVAGISGVLLAFPSGALAHRLGRRRFIRLCLGALTVILLVIPLSGLAAGRLGLGPRLLVFLALMFIYGIFWIGVVVNSFPMLWQMADYSTMGIYTGLYYTFSQTAAILAPPLSGAVIDFFGYPGLFVFGAAAMLAAWFVMAGVRAGEPSGEPAEKSPDSGEAAESAGSR